MDLIVSFCFFHYFKKSLPKADQEITATNLLKLNWRSYRGKIVTVEYAIRKFVSPSTEFQKMWSFFLNMYQNILKSNNMQPVKSMLMNEMQRVITNSREAFLLPMPRNICWVAVPFFSREISRDLYEEAWKSAVKFLVHLSAENMIRLDESVTLLYDCLNAALLRTARSVGASKLAEVVINKTLNNTPELRKSLTFLPIQLRIIFTESLFGPTRVQKTSLALNLNTNSMTKNHTSINLSRENKIAKRPHESSLQKTKGHCQPPTVKRRTINENHQQNDENPCTSSSLFPEDVVMNDVFVEDIGALEDEIEGLNLEENYSTNIAERETEGENIIDINTNIRVNTPIALSEPVLEVYMSQSNNNSPDLMMPTVAELQSPPDRHEKNHKYERTPRAQITRNQPLSLRNRVVQTPR
jgi:hypothetical protein